MIWRPFFARVKVNHRRVYSRILVKVCAVAMATRISRISRISLKDAILVNRNFPNKKFTEMPLSSSGRMLKSYFSCRQRRSRSSLFDTSTSSCRSRSRNRQACLRSLLRSENEDEYEFVCLVMVRIRSCLLHVMQAGTLVSTARRQVKF